MIKIKLMRNNSLPNVMYKGDGELIADITGTFRDQFSLMKTTFDIEYDFMSNRFWNYVDPNYLIVETGRKYYYFINNITVGPKGITTLSLELDVLKTYESEIGELRVVLDGSGFSSPSTTLISGSNRPMRVDKQFVKKFKFPRYFDRKESTGSYILITSQNGYSNPS